MVSPYEQCEELIERIEKLNAWIELAECRQMQLLDIDKFVRFCHKNLTFSFQKPLILKLWQLGFIRAEIIQVSSPIGIAGINCFHEEENLFLYTDCRSGQQVGDDLSDLITKLTTYSSGAKIFFHPFRCYILNDIKKYWALTIPEEYLLEGIIDDNELEKLLLEKLELRVKSFDLCK